RVSDPSVRGDVPGAHLARLHDQGGRGIAREGLPRAPAASVGTVPDVVGLKVDEAKKILADANFTGIVQEVPASQPVGEVVAQNPGAGASLELGSVVTIQVSNGKAPPGSKVGPHVVPSVIGVTQHEAETLLKSAGYVPVVSQLIVSDVNLGGLVLSQNPDGGTKAKPGTGVEIVVAKYQKGKGGKP